MSDAIVGEGAAAPTMEGIFEAALEGRTVKFENSHTDEILVARAGSEGEGNALFIYWATMTLLGQGKSFTRKGDTLVLGPEAPNNAPWYYELWGRWFEMGDIFCRAYADGYRRKMDSLADRYGVRVRTVSGGSGIPKLLRTEVRKEKAGPGR